MRAISPTSLFRSTMAFLGLGLGLALSSSWAAVQDDAKKVKDEAVTAPTRVALLSLIGKDLQVIVFQPGTGSHLDRNQKQNWTLSSPVYDQQALSLLQEALKTVHPQAQVLSYAGDLPEAFSRPSSIVDSEQLKLPDELLAALREDKAEQLLLLTRRRHESFLKTAKGHVGDGMLEGMGFYVDNYKRMRRTDTNEVGQGFLAPYVYLRLSLIDLSTNKVLKQRDILASSTLSSARSKDGFSPWEVLSAEEKLLTLSKMLNRELKKAAVEVLE